MNPITVRDLRRLKRWYVLEGGTLFIILGMSASFLFATLHSPTLLDALEIQQDELSFCLSWAPIILCFYGLLFPLGFATNGLTKFRQSDELMELVPLTPRQQVDGYLWTSIILSVYIISLFLPFSALAFLLGRISYWPLLLYPGIFFCFQAFILYCLTFTARTGKTQIGNVIATIVAVASFYLAVPWYGVIWLWFEFFRWHAIHPFYGFGFFTFWFAFPMAVLIYGVIGYKLVLNHFQNHRRPLWKALLLSAGVYLLLSTSLAVVYMGLALIVHQVI